MKPTQKLYHLFLIIAITAFTATQWCHGTNGSLEAFMKKEIDSPDLRTAYNQCQKNCCTDGGTCCRQKQRECEIHAICLYNCWLFRNAHLLEPKHNNNGTP